MAMAKRVFLFVLTNILIVATISILLNILGVGGYMQYGVGGYAIDYNNLLAFCLIWGFAGSFISLMLSRIMAKMMMGVRVIDAERPKTDAEKFLVSTVHRFARTSGISVMPQVGIYDSPDLNAFATGPTKNRSLVAVSSGLLTRMNKDEVEGVLAHEVAHIANGDMVTMTLVQGVVNAFVMFFARILAFAVSSALGGRSSDNDRPNPFFNMILVFVFEIAFGFLGMIVVGFYSRQREFRADGGGAKLAGTHKMVAALKALQINFSDRYASAAGQEQDSVATLKIFGKTGGFLALLSTHPPLEVRIERLSKLGSY